MSIPDPKYSGLAVIQPQGWAFKQNLPNAPFNVDFGTHTSFYSGIWTARNKIGRHILWCDENDNFTLMTVLTFGKFEGIKRAAGH